MRKFKQNPSNKARKPKKSFVTKRTQRTRETAEIKVQSDPVTGFRGVSRQRNVPMAVSTSLLRPNRLGVKGNPMYIDSVDNEGAIRVIGTCIGPNIQEIKTSRRLITVAQWPNCLENGVSGSSDTDTLCIGMNPRHFYGRIAAFASIYTKYAIRKLTVHYIPSCSSTTTGSFSVAHCVDSANLISVYATDGGSTLNSTEILENPNAHNFPFRTGGSMKPYVYDGKELWFCQAPLPGPSGTASNGLPFTGNQLAAAVAFFRQANQFSIVLGNDATSTVDSTHGRFFFEYVIDFYGTCAISEIPVRPVMDMTTSAISHTAICKEEKEQKESQSVGDDPSYVKVVEKDLFEPVKGVAFPLKMQQKKISLVN